MLQIFPRTFMKWYYQTIFFTSARVIFTIVDSKPIEKQSSRSSESHFISHASPWIQKFIPMLFPQGINQDAVRSAELEQWPD